MHTCQQASQQYFGRGGRGFLRVDVLVGLTRCMKQLFHRSRWLHPIEPTSSLPRTCTTMYEHQKKRFLGRRRPLVRRQDGRGSHGPCTYVHSILVYLFFTQAAFPHAKSLDTGFEPFQGIFFCYFYLLGAAVSFSPFTLDRCGNDYGWSRFEGSRCQEAQEDRIGNCATLSRSGLVFPIYEYCHPDYDSSTSSENEFTGGNDLCGARTVEGLAVIGEENIV